MKTIARNTGALATALGVAIMSSFSAPIVRAQATTSRPTPAKSQPAPPQAAAPQPAPTKAQIIAAARDIMTRARYATLTTIGEDGQPQARIMDPMVPDKDMTVWVGTNPLSRKVGEIRKNGRVTLLYFNTTRLEYATLTGVADIVTDKAEKARHWKAEWSSFYKEGAKGDDFVLIRVRPARIEIVSPQRKLVNDPKTWRPAGVALP